MACPEHPRSHDPNSKVDPSSDPQELSPICAISCIRSINAQSHTQRISVYAPATSPVDIARTLACALARTLSTHTRLCARSYARPYARLCARSYAQYAHSYTHLCLVLSLFLLAFALLELAFMLSPLPCSHKILQLCLFSLTPASEKVQAFPIA